MPIQSYLMMYFAGAGWQIGKRKISAIPNDKFNVMSAKDLLEGFTADLRETIPTLERSLQDITPLIKTLIAQYGEFVTVALKEIPQAAQGVLESQLTKEGTLSKLIIEVVGGGTVTGGGTGSKALLFAQKQLQDEVDRLKAQQRGVNDDPNRFTPQQQAINEQTAFEKAKILARQKSVPGRIAFSKTKQPVPQLGRGRVTKKAAGQSQRLERSSLIRSITANTKLLKAGGESANVLARYVNRIRNSQQQLVNLLARYRF